jgi:AraC-like DNA-binding protein
MHYLARWRLQVSAQRLSTSHYSAARIAYEVGYESEAAFNRAFKRLFGAPPAMWRKRCEDPGDETARTVGGLGLRGKSLR